MYLTEGYFFRGEPVVLLKKSLCRNPSHTALSTIARMTPSLPQGGRQPKGAALTPSFVFFSDTGHAPRGEGRQTPSARGSITIQYCPLQVFYRAKKIKGDSSIQTTGNFVLSFLKPSRKQHTRRFSRTLVPPPPPRRWHPRIAMMTYSLLPISSNHIMRPVPQGDWWRKRGYGIELVAYNEESPN